MTPRMKETLDFVRGFISEHGYSPSFDEIAEAIGLKSKSGVNRLVCALSDRGHVTVLPGKRRSIAVVHGYTGVNLQQMIAKLPPWRRARVLALTLELIEKEHEAINA